MDHLLFAAEQYAAAQANAAAAAQYYANAAMNAASGTPSGTMLLPGVQAGTLVVTQPGPAQNHMLSLPPSHTWSGNTGSGQAPPAPPAPNYNQHDDRNYNQHDDRDREKYEDGDRRKSDRSSWRDRSRSRDRDRDRRKKSRRDRSRDRSRSRERRRHRSRSRGRDRDDHHRDDHRDRHRRRERDRSPVYKNRGDSPGSDDDWRTSPGNDTIMIRGLPQYVTEQHVQDNIMSHGLEAKDIRLIRKKDTGASRGFAFVEFSTVDDAKTWIKNQQGWLNFDGNQVSMHYSVPREQRAFEQTKVLTDWICLKCGVQNFRRREVCFKCNGEKAVCDTAYDQYDQGNEVSTHPTNTVLLSGLDALTTEDSVLNVLGPLTTLPLKNVKIGRDPLTSMSRGVCYVEMNSVVDSMFLHNQLIAAPPSIDGKVVEVSYHKQLNTQIISNSSQNQAAANSALEAAQWSNKSTNKSGSVSSWSEDDIQKMAEYSADMYAKTKEEKSYYVEYYKKFYREGGDTSAAEVALKSDKNEESSEKIRSDTVIVDGVEYKRYPPPDTSTYQYDETSGYYYDPVSTLYYDANSQYYYNSKTNKFHYWDARNETFLPAPDNGGGKKEDEKKSSSKEKVKSAKRIQKDMEKWAKTLNQRKDQSRMSDVNTDVSAGSTGQKGSEDIAFNLLQRKEDQTNSSGGLAGLAGYGGGSDEETEPDESSSGSMSVAEMKLTDWVGLACLLCQRQFKSRDQLTKHNTLSDLHTTNLKNWRSQYSEAGGDNKAGGIQYRDRAKERRNKFGDDDKPIPNKFKEKYMRAMEESTAAKSSLADAPKVAESNIGNKMLQKMGWKDGQGLGKKNQGRTDIILAEQRAQGAGLGNQQAAGNPNDSYKENARKTLWSRYNSAH